MSQATHTFCDLIRWLQRDRRIPYYHLESYHQWCIATSEWNRGYHGPREECDSPYDPRWPMNEHNERAWRERERRKAHLRARGFTFVN